MNYVKLAKSFGTKKKFGQNFLIDEKVLDSIIEFAQIDKNDIVVEIGPGIGFLTDKLVQKANRVIAFEIDKEAICQLKKLNSQNLQVINEDILKVDLAKYFNYGQKIKVVANIPYYITSPIIAHLLGEIDDIIDYTEYFEYPCDKQRKKNRYFIKEMILMVQYEVGQRIIATANSKNKQYGSLSILSNFFANTKFLAKVNRSSFLPQPKVDSALIKFEVEERPKVISRDYKFLKKIVKAIFSQRRKNIKNSLISAIGKENKEIIEKVLLNLNISPNLRGEQLDIFKINKISDSILDLLILQNLSFKV